jgi:hypothetical protein
MVKQLFTAIHSQRATAHHERNQQLNVRTVEGFNQRFLRLLPWVLIPKNVIYFPD